MTGFLAILSGPSDDIPIRLATGREDARAALPPNAKEALSLARHRNAALWDRDGPGWIITGRVVEFRDGIPIGSEIVFDYTC